MTKTYSKIVLVAGSIGAYFSMNAEICDYIEKAYFISPIVNLERLIVDMISWAGTTEGELEDRKVIPVGFGDDLSWNIFNMLEIIGLAGMYQQKYFMEAMIICNQ